MEWNQHVLMILLTAVMLVSLLALCYAFQMLDRCIAVSARKMRETGRCRSCRGSSMRERWRS